MLVLVRGSPERRIAMGCGMMNASIASGIGKAMKPNKNRRRGEQSRPRIAIRYAGRATGITERMRRRLVQALDPQFAEPAHVHPAGPIAHPFTVCVRTCTWVTTLIGGNGTKPSARNHDLPCATALSRQPRCFALSLRQPPWSGGWNRRR